MIESNDTARQSKPSEMTSVRLAEMSQIPVEYEELRAAGMRRWGLIWKQRLAVFFLVFSDVLLALAAWGLAYLLQGLWGPGPLTSISIATIAPGVTVWIGLRALLGLYPGYGLDQVEELRRHTYSVLGTVSSIAIFAVAFQFGGQLSRLQLLLGFFGILLLAPFVRYLGKLKMKSAGVWGKPVIVMGSGQNEGRVRGKVRRLLQERWELGYNPVAVFNCGLPRQAPAEGSNISGFYSGALRKSISEAARLACRRGVDTAIIAMPYTRREQLVEVASQVSLSFRHVLVTPNLDGITNSAVVARDLGGTFAVEIKYNLLDPWSLRAKRVMDLAATIVGGILVLPLIAVLALLVYLESGGPVFYRAKRMGRNDNLFSCLKFRTMVPDAEMLLQQLLEDDPRAREEYARYHKLRDDPRVTRVGHFLRRTSLDELPQLWNVLKGEMSLVGPRPYLPRESLDIGVMQGEILRVPPGITGPWQVSGRNHASFEERVRMDGIYVRDWSVWLDIVLLARTVKSVLSGGAY